MIRKLAALAGGWLSDPYVCCTLGSLLLLRGLDAIAAQATAVQQQLAAVQAQAAQTLNGAAPAPPSEPAGDGYVWKYTPDSDWVRSRVDVAGEHEDLHP